MKNHLADLNYKHIQFTLTERKYCQPETHDKFNQNIFLVN